jgi:site-specific recombinase XerD
VARLFKFPKSPYWYIDFKYQGRRYRRSLSVTSKKAADEIRKRVELKLAQGKNPFAGETLGPILKRYLEYCEGINSPSTLYNKKIYCRRFLEYFGDVSLTLEDVERYFKNHGGGNATKNRELAVLRHAYNFTIKRGHVETNPTEGIALLPEKRKAVKILSPAELEKWFAWCRENDPTLYDLSVIAFNTGLRKGDIVKIRGEDLRGNRLAVAVSKTKRLQYIPVNDDAREVLERRKKDGRIFNLSRFDKRFKRGLRGTGLNFRFHDFRHMFATAILGLGTDLRTTQGLLGHSKITTTERYLALIDARLDEAVGKLSGKHTAKKDAD